MAEKTKAKTLHELKEHGASSVEQVSKYFDEVLDIIIQKIEATKKEHISDAERREEEFKFRESTISDVNYLMEKSKQCEGDWESVFLIVFITLLFAYLYKLMRMM